MRAVMIAIGLLIVAAGCQTTPEDQQAAGVEDRSKPGAKPGAKPVESPQVGKLDVTKPQARDSVGARHPRRESRREERDHGVAGARDVENLARLRTERQRRGFLSEQRHAALAARDEQHF